MAYMNYDIIGSFNLDYDPLICPETLLNWYEVENANSPLKKALLPFPGSLNVMNIKELAQNTGARGAYSWKGRAFFVFGANLYEMITTNQVLPNNEIVRGTNYTIIGTLTTTVGPVYFTNSSSAMMLTDGAKGYYYDSSFHTILDSNFPSAPGQCAFLDGRFLVNFVGTNQFFASNIEDPSTWQAANYGRLLSQGDTTKGIAVMKSRIYLFGQTTTETWYDAGTPNFPFLPDRNVVFNQGLLATASLAGTEGFLIWLGQSEAGVTSVFMTRGSSSMPVSTPQVELQFQSYSRLDDAVGFLMRINSQLFYILTFPTDDVTWCYNLITQRWSNLAMIDGSRYFGNCHLFVNNTHYMGRYDSPDVYEISREFVTNDGEAMKRQRTGPMIMSAQGKRAVIDNMEVYFRQGVTENDFRLYDSYYIDANGEVYTNPDGNPYVSPDFLSEDISITNFPHCYLSVSRNGGKSYGFQYKSRLGALGDYEYRTMFRALGTFQMFTPQITFYDKMGLIMTGANLAIEEISA